MKLRSALSFLMLILAAAPQQLAAQTGTVAADVTVNVPINLTQLGPEITKIKLFCSITSVAITNAPNNTVKKDQELPVSGGQVVTTASLLFSITGLDNPVGKQFTVACNTQAYSSTSSSWGDLNDTATNPSFKVSSPMRNGLTFTW